MTTTVVKTIGTSSRDYSTLQAWEDACPANLVSVDQIWKGEVYNDSEFLGDGTLMLDVAGQTTDATRYMWLTAASGQSFADHANKLTNPLKYDQSKGVGIRRTGSYANIFKFNAAVNFLCERLQFYYDSTYSSNYYIPFQGHSLAVTTFKGCIYLSRRTTAIDIAGGIWVNSLFVSLGTSRTGNMIANVNSNVPSLYNCTIVRASDLGTAEGTAVNTTGVVQNCAIFNFTTAIGGSPSSTTYNASDLSSLPGSNNVTSLTFGSQFTGTTSSAPDFSAKSGGGLVAGARDAGNTNDLDIIGQTRSTTTPTIGAWEFVSAGGSSFRAGKPTVIAQAIGGMY